METPPPPAILPVIDQQRDAAFALVFQSLAEAERRQQIELLVEGPGGEALADGLLGAWRADRLVGTILYQLQPGRLAVVWPPQVVPPEPESTADALLAAALDRLAGQDVSIAQALLDSPEHPEAKTLLRGGFHHAANLLYLACHRGDFPAAQPTTALEFEPYTSASHERFARVVDATYVQTLDCPALDGVRRINDVLAGYRTAGVFDPQRWLLVRDGESDVGCLLLTDYPRHGTWELVYMGIVPSARGRGLGQVVARHAQWLAQRAGRERLVLAVDAKNWPAIAMYSAVGFRPWDQRAVFLRVFQTRSPHTGKQAMRGTEAWEL